MSRCVQWLNYGADQVRHNREEKRSKEAMQQLWTENDELHAKLQNAQRAAEAAAREAAAKRRPPGPGLASLLASIQSTEHDIEAEIVKLAQGSASVDAAVKASLLISSLSRRGTCWLQTVDIAAVSASETKIQSNRKLLNRNSNPKNATFFSRPSFPIHPVAVSSRVRRFADGFWRFAWQEALQEKLEEYLESGRNGRRPPNSVDSRSLAGKLLQLSRNPGSQSVQDLQRLARLSIETLRQLELQLEFANAAQKGLADMYITECEASK